MKPINRLWLVLLVALFPAVAHADDSCAYARDGECDEPIYCEPNTDTTDCSASGASPGPAIEAVEPETGPNSCQFAFDDACDEPNLCAPGTDTADCSGSVEGLVNAIPSDFGGDAGSQGWTMMLWTIVGILALIAVSVLISVFVLGRSSLDSARSALSQAKLGDNDALLQLFRGFIPESEDIYTVRYLGMQGWILGSHSFVCLTNKRVADIVIGSFGNIEFQDAYLDHINSSIILQPSRLLLYILVAISIVGAATVGGGLVPVLMLALGNGLAVTAGVATGLLLAFVLVFLTTRLYYMFKKCGLLLVVREGAPVYAFSDRKRLGEAQEMLRLLSEVREQRIREIGA